MTTREVESIVHESPKDPAILTGASRVHVELGNPKQALAYADRAVAAAPGDAWPLINRGIARYEGCDFPKARQDGLAALRAARNPRHQEAALAIVNLSNRPAGCNNLAQEREIGRQAGALVEATGGLAARVQGETPGFDPDGSAAPSTLSPAAGSAARAAAAPPAAFATWGAEKDYAKLNQWMDRAEEAMKGSDWAALKWYSGLMIAMDPDQPRPRVMRLRAAKAERDYAQVIQDATEGLRTAWPLDFQAERAWAFNLTGRWTDALRDADAVLKAEPGRAAMWLARGQARKQLGLPPEAYLEDFRRAAQLEGTYRSALDGELDELRRAGRPDGARERPSKNGATPPVQGPGRAGLLLGAGAAAFLLVAALAFAIGRSLKPAAARQTVIYQGVAPEGGARVASGSYDIGKEIGRGGMGSVYEGYDRNLGRRVAIKVLRGELQRDPGQRERFLKEARTVAALDHPNILRIHAVIREEDDRTLLVFERVDGRTLRQLADAKPARRLSLEETGPILRDVCAALEYAHFKRVIHRDIKPSNVMVTDADQVKVMDFGIARVTHDSLGTLTGSVSGTPCYMAPELEDGRVGPEADVFSLGVTAYELLTGRLPYGAATPGAMLRQKLEAGFPPVSALVPGLPKGLDEFFRDALHPSPGLRLASAKAFRDEFARAAATR
ncbi:MAG: serine/threonine protein kinase [Elusimicrobia bacterium]|nr:serine/threonine protein kinase [Elusimicrobiota bacterium]